MAKSFDCSFLIIMQIHLFITTSNTFCCQVPLYARVLCIDTVLSRSLYKHLFAFVERALFVRVCARMCLCVFLYSMHECVCVCVYGLFNLPLWGPE